ncbi:MAG: glycosyltransferase family 9 protein [Bacteroidales bacterium]|nr:glycosyltransferase family 9 protein [Bacteroidales bacterium]MBP5613564.1 glycosyltransferase family 9 protein [Bacteroidales bacterium]
MKILVIRLSSIGDIVLATPVIRCLKRQLPDAGIHFLCKPSMKTVVETNPYIDNIHTFRREDATLVNRLRDEEFDYVVDLQKNRYSRRLCRRLHVPHSSFPKLNFRKLLLVLFKWNLMPRLHIVDRYFRAVERLGVKNDGKGLVFCIDEADSHELDEFFLPEKYVAVAVGSRHATKQIPAETLEAVAEKCRLPLVFLGDSHDSGIVAGIERRFPDHTLNLCGKLSLRASAACVAKAETLLTGDTGLMHIAAALQKRTVSVWGNTVPAFGMYPYQPHHPENCIILENNNCRCRPCSKLGYGRCPLGHFRCMRGIPPARITELLNQSE